MVYIVGEGGPRDVTSIPLATKKGTLIPNSRRWEKPPQALKVSEDQWRALCPPARLRSLSATYNCVGLVFASRRTWVETDSLALILDEDGFHRVDEEKAVEPGDVAVYRNSSGEITHLGVVLEKQPDVGSGRFRFKLLSKWGAGGEYIHYSHDVPEILGGLAEFVSERRQSR